MRTRATCRNERAHDPACDSAPAGGSDVRAGALRRWVGQRLGLEFDWAVVSADASSRRYFRASASAGRGGLRHWIAVDAPPATENTPAFIKVAALMAHAGLNVPTVHAADLERGFMLLSDMGDCRCIDVVGPDNVDGFMTRAIDALVAWQCHSRPGVLPEYDRDRLHAELGLFVDWYLVEYRALSLSARDRARLGDVRRAIVDRVASQPRVFVHRDYMLRNLMACHPLPGIIDFQDALYGPVTYDIASLCKDAFISWPEARVLDWQQQYWCKAKAAGLPVGDDWPTFLCNLEWMGVQRHLKILGLFARLARRDAKPGYIEDEPRFIDYLAPVVARYPALAPICDVLPDHPA